MSSCPQFENLGVLYVYGDLSNAEASTYERHMTGCPKCAKEIEAVKATLQLMDRRQEPERDAAFWQEFDAKLDEKLQGESLRYSSKGSFGWIPQILAAAAILALGMFFGKYLATPNPSELPPVVSAQSPLDEAFVREANAYMRQSKTLLIGLSNLELTSETARDLDLALHRRASRALINQTVQLRNAYPRQAQSRLMELMNELEMIFLQIAHLEAEGSIDGLEVIKEGVSKGDLLLKINLEQLAPSFDPSPSKQDVSL